MEHSCTDPLEVEDAVALVAVLAALEAVVLGRRLATGEVDALRHALAQGGAVLPGADESEIAAALSALNGRVRDSIG